MSTSKFLDDQCLSADLHFDLTLTAQWGDDWLISFNKFKTKPFTSPPHRPQTYTNYDEESYFQRYFLPRSPTVHYRTSKEMRVFVPLQEMPEEWSVPCMDPEYTSCHVLLLQESDQIKNSTDEKSSAFHYNINIAIADYFWVTTGRTITARIRRIMNNLPISFRVLLIKGKFHSQPLPRTVTL